MFTLALVIFLVLDQLSKYLVNSLMNLVPQTSLIPLTRRYIRITDECGNSFDKKNQFIEARRFYKKYLELKPASEEKDFVLSRLEKFQPKKKEDLLPLCLSKR